MHAVCLEVVEPQKGIRRVRGTQQIQPGIGRKGTAGLGARRHLRRKSAGKIRPRTTCILVKQEAHTHNEQAHVMLAAEGLRQALGGA